MRREKKKRWFGFWYCKIIIVVIDCLEPPHLQNPFEAPAVQPTVLDFCVRVCLCVFTKGVWMFKILNAELANLVHTWFENLIFSTFDYFVLSKYLSVANVRDGTAQSAGHWACCCPKAKHQRMNNASVINEKHENTKVRFRLLQLCGLRAPNLLNGIVSLKKNTVMKKKKEKTRFCIWSQFFFCIHIRLEPFTIWIPLLFIGVACLKLNKINLGFPSYDG